jgi:hypothetical protein
VSDYNASDTKAIRRAAKAAKLAEAQRREVVFSLMSSPAGRNYVHDLLLRCHVFTSSFTSDAICMAFNEGERNIGLQLLTDVMQFAPDQYVQMMREENDRRIAADSGHSGNNEDDRGPDSGWAGDPIGSNSAFTDPGDGY